MNSASWHATVEDTLHFLLHRPHRLPHGYWAPQVRVPACTPGYYTCLAPSLPVSLSVSRMLFLARHRCRMAGLKKLLWHKVFPFMLKRKMYHQPLWDSFLSACAWALIYTCASVCVIEPAGCWQLNTRLIYAGSDLGEYPAACEIHACWAAKLSGSVVGFPPEDPWLKHRWVN